MADLLTSVTGVRRARLLRCVKLVGGWDRLVDAIVALERREAQAERERALRRRELVEALSARGCTLRADSHLCRQYIDRGERSLDVVVDETEEIQFFYRQTAYASILRSLRPARRYYDRGLDGYGYEYDSEYESDDDYVDEETLRRRAKELALQRYLAAGRAIDALPRKLKALAK
jgi:hypothetical protein